MATSSSSWATVLDFLQSSSSKAIEAFQKAHWDEICRIASKHYNSKGCRALDSVACGMNNVVRMLEFSDGTRWVARVHISSTDSDITRIKLESEVATMQYTSQHSSLPVPRILSYDLDPKGPAGVPFILMELIPGTVAMDALGGYNAHRGVIPRRHRPNFYRSVAACHVQITSLRFPKIGIITRTGDGGYEMGPLPGIGGPFETATAFFEAWANSVQFKRNREAITNMMQRGPIPAERMVAIVENFPKQIKAMAARISTHDNGPFPLDHDDFLHSNILVDETNFDVTGIIDWEGACAVPWELVAFPEFIQTLPASFDLPENYDQNGEPLDEDTKDVWRERRDYVDMVKSFETEDCLLSDCLGSARCQALAYSYGAYTSVGKLGFYDQVIKFVQDNE